MMAASGGREMTSLVRGHCLPRGEKECSRQRPDGDGSKRNL